MVRFSVGLDLGSQQVALAVYDYARKCSVPLEVDNNKGRALRPKVLVALQDLERATKAKNATLASPATAASSSVAWNG